MGKDSRSERRSSLFLAARLRVSGGIVVDVTIRNLSTTGALIEAAQLPAQDTDVDLSRGNLTTSGKVAWVRPGRGGIKFHAPIDLTAWIPPSILSSDQQRVDTIQAQMRSGTQIEVQDPELGRAPECLNARVAEELGFVSRMLEALGDELATDWMAARHGAQLQNLDIAIQLLGHLATVLTAGDAAAAIRGIGMEDLRRRLSRKSL